MQDEIKKTDTEHENIIKEIIKELLEKIGFKCEIEVIRTTADEEVTLIFNIQTNESSFLIGQYGVNLQSIQHLTRLLVRKITNEKINFTLDVNSYRMEKNESIEKLAREASEQCLREKQEVIMRPMSAYERRIVHIKLANNKQIKTESIGDGENRRVLVKLAENNQDF